MVLLVNTWGDFLIARTAFLDRSDKLLMLIGRGADYGHAGVRGMPSHLTALNTCRPESVEKQHKQARLYISGSGKL